MNTVPVIWLSLHDGIEARGTWDHGLLLDLLDNHLAPTGYDYAHHRSPPPKASILDGAILIVPGQHHTSPADLARINETIASLYWCLLIITGDEEHLFPLNSLATHPRLSVWVQPAREHPRVNHHLPFGYPPDTAALLRHIPTDKSWVWFFAGQDNNRIRHACIEALRADGRGKLSPTESFSAGLSRYEYLQTLAASRIAPCPSATATPDTFRVYEALEADCIPIIDNPDHFTRVFFGSVPPFPVVSSTWSDYSTVIDSISNHHVALANICAAYWGRYKSHLANALGSTIAAVSGTPRSLSDITVLIPTSPIPSHPSTAIIEETISSIRSRLDLKSAPIIIAADGVRIEQEHFRTAYDAYLHDLLHLCRTRWHNVTVRIFDEHIHQSGMTRAVLPDITTPLLLFVEHDTPLTGHIPFDALSDIILSGEVNLARLYHEVTMQKEHEPLMDRTRVKEYEGFSLLPTIQWSQRPNLASTDYYRKILFGCFTANELSMVETRMHSVIQVAGWEGWDEHCICVYLRDGDNIQGSYHLDGRGDEPSWETS